MLVEGIRDKYVAVSRKYMRGVFDFDTIELQPLGIGNNARRGANNPLDGVDHVRQCVLNRSATRRTLSIVNFSIGGPVRWKMLPGDDGHLERPSESASQDCRAHCSDRWVCSERISDPGGNCATRDRRL